MSTPAPTPTPRRTLVTGGAGFIGSHLTEALLARGDHVTVIDDLSTGRRENLPRSLPAGLRFIEADLAAALQGFSNGETFDEIYHLAAAVGVRLIVDEPIKSIETNVFQTSALLQFALSHGPAGAPAPTLIASSSEVYGKSERSPFHEDDDVVYGATTKTRWSYACSKAIDEYLALAHHARHGLGAVVVRFFNTVGPRQVGSYGMVLPNFVASAIRGEPLTIHGDGHQTRCFCDVRDVAGALPRLVGNRGCHGRVLNLGSDAPISMNRLADLVIHTLGSSSHTVHVPYEIAYSPGFEDLRQRRPDLTRLREAIGFAPTRTLEQTIVDIAHTLGWLPAGGASVTTVTGTRARGPMP
ncbi:MAG: GDP-mannose 4,6-dehydratase [Phycisphaeraceae bacterium]|nr:GDP-mannose 4,6-dehydratase [Phycisphaeraceae bacterium]